MAGTTYEKSIEEFTRRMNRVLSSGEIKIELVKSTGLSIARSLFRNNNSVNSHPDCNGKCIICKNAAANSEGAVTSTVTGKSYRIPTNLTCQNGGIYIFDGKCSDQYTGKTTVAYGNRMLEHLHKQKQSSVFKHVGQCGECKVSKEFKCSFVEDYRSRGKYSLSEREYLWNYRIKGIINDQKTLMEH